MPLEPNTELGRYEIRSLIGTGGMGEVYLAEDPQLRRKIAVKVLPAEFVDSKERLKRFEREAFATSSLNHPNIITIYEIGESQGSYFIATEFVDGQSLRDLMSKGDDLELSEILDIGMQIASALAAAHSAGVIHRDVKPENIMVRRDGIIKVLDFGLAKLAEAIDSSDAAGTEAPTLHNTAPGIIMGTPAYMSPEQARAKGVDPRTDIWSLGVVLYEMASGHLPFRGESTADTIGLVLHKEPPVLSDIDGRIPPEFDRIVAKAITKDRNDRYQVVKDLGIDLKALRRSLEFESARERVSPQNVTTKGRIAPAAAPTRIGGDLRTAQHDGKAKGVLRLAAVAAAALIGVFAVWYFYPWKPKESSINSVAVLPFVNVEKDPNAEYLTDGLTEGIINNLSQLPQLKVISRSSAFKFKDKEIDIDAVAKALGVGAVVMGRVQQQGGEMQISIEVVNAADKTQIFGSRFSSKTTELQELQSQISREIADKLRVQLTAPQQGQLAKASTKNPEAYQLFLYGRFYQRKGSAEDLKKSLGYLTQATTLDPDFAIAFVLLANSYSNLAGIGVIDPKEGTAKAKVALEKALAIDEKLAEAHSLLGILKTDEWDWPGAERSYRRAIELNPGLYAAHVNYSSYLSCVGKFTEALSEIRRAQELEPLLEVLKSEEGKTLYLARRFDEAVQRTRDHLALDPENSYAQSYLGIIYLKTGQYDDAIAAFQKSMEIDGEETTSTLCYLGAAYAGAGRTKEARGILDKIKAGKEYVSPAELAFLYIALGEREAAIKSLERAYTEHDLQLQYLKMEPLYDPLRSDPRFGDLVGRIGFPN